MERLWQVDFARGTTVILMLACNWLFALSFLGLVQTDFSQGFWWLASHAVAFSFVFIAGFAAWLDFSRHKSESRLFKRGAKVFAFGMLITFLTWLFLRDGFVVFGALHLIGLSVFLSPFFIRLGKKELAAFGISVIALGIALSFFSFPFPWLAWLGFVPVGFYSIDFFPALPWLGVFVLGVLSSKFFSLKAEKAPASAEVLCFAGRHSLFIYLIHQPMLLAVLKVAGFSVF